MTGSRNLCVISSEVNLKSTSLYLKISSTGGVMYRFLDVFKLFSRKKAKLKLKLAGYQSKFKMAIMPESLLIDHHILDVNYRQKYRYVYKTQRISTSPHACESSSHFEFFLAVDSSASMSLAGRDTFTCQVGQSRVNK